MKRVSSESQFGHLLIRNCDPRRVGIGIEITFHGETGLRGSGGDEFDDDLMTDRSAVGHHRRPVHDHWAGSGDLPAWVVGLAVGSAAGGRS